MADKFKLSFIQLSDLHVSTYRDLLAPMVPNINNEHVDFIVITGDLLDAPTEENYHTALRSLDKIVHRVFVIPGDYDYNELWESRFGKRFRSTAINDYTIDLLDTSAMGHVLGIGWNDWLQTGDPDQHKWLLAQLSSDSYHLIFSHHPFLGQLRGNNSDNDYLSGNVRAVYSGHFHETDTIHFTYDKPRSSFAYGFCTVPLKFHGSSVYLLVNVKPNDEIVQVPKIIGVKKTAW